MTSELPESWSSCTLGDAATWLSGGTPRTSEPKFWGGDIPWISAASLTHFYINDSARCVTEQGVQNGTRVVEPMTIICVVRGMSLKTEFRIGIAKRQVAFGQDCKALVPNPGFDPLFLAYAMRGRQGEILNMVDEAGHGTGRLQTDRLQSLMIAVPPYEEQVAIGRVLGALDDKIDANSRLAEVSEELAVALVASAPSRRALGELASMARHQLKPEQFANATVEHFSLPAFDNGRMPELCAGTAIKSNKFLVRKQSVLVSKLNPRISRIWYADPSHGKIALASTEFVVLEPLAICAPTVLWAACSGREFASAVAERVTGTTGSHQRVKPQDVLDTVVPDATALSTRQLELVDGLVLGALAARRESAVLVSLRDVLLPPLVSGRLRVREAESLVGEAV